MIEGINCFVDDEGKNEGDIHLFGIGAMLPIKNRPPNERPHLLLERTIRKIRLGIELLAFDGAEDDAIVTEHGSLKQW